jgi:predicted lipoprotein with Yx(FWY)xxD motif
MKTLLLSLAVTAAAVAAVPAASTSTAPTVSVRSSAYGPILFDGRGKALYAFTHDRRGGRSTCYGACARAWPPYLLRGALKAGPRTKQSLLGSVRRRDGRRQVTYNGRPLYYYVGDGPGQVKCQNVDEFGGLWLVVRASGRLVH